MRGIVAILLLVSCLGGQAFRPIPGTSPRSFALACSPTAADTAAKTQAKVLLSGDASGGYFRACMRNEAKFHRSLKGYLKELELGKSEIVLEGRRGSIDAFLRYCRKNALGLSQRIVIDSIEYTDVTGEFSDFDVYALEDDTSEA